MNRERAMTHVTSEWERNAYLAVEWGAGIGHGHIREGWTGSDISQVPQTTFGAQQCTAGTARGFWVRVTISNHAGFPRSLVAGLMIYLISHPNRFSSKAPDTDNTLAPCPLQCQAPIESQAGTNEGFILVARITVKGHWKIAAGALTLAT